MSQPIACPPAQSGWPALFLLLFVVVGCPGSPRSKAAGDGQGQAVGGGGEDSDTTGSEAGASDTGRTDSGAPPSPPEFSAPCPVGPFFALSGSAWEDFWRPASHPVEGGTGRIFIETAILEMPLEWGSSAFGIWDGRRLPHGRPDSFVSTRAGWFRVAATPVDETGRRGETLVCDLEYVHTNGIVVEMGTDPLFLGDRELHFVQEGGAMFSIDDDLCWCNPQVDDTGLVGDDDFLSLFEWDSGRPEFPMSQEEGGIFGVSLGLQRRELVVLDNGDGELAESGLPFETEVRIYLQGTLAFAGRAAIPPGESWTVGLVDMERAAFEPATADDFRTVESPGTCR